MTYNKKYQAEYRRANKERLKELHKQYRERPDIKAKKREYDNKWNEDPLHKQTKNNSRLIREYNLPLEEYDKLFEKQNGCCSICDRHQSEFKKRLSVDHCHETGKVRGLLCSGCNQGIGHLKDSTILLSKAIKYLDDNRF